MPDHLGIRSFELGYQGRLKMPLSFASWHDSPIPINPMASPVVNARIRLAENNRKRACEGRLPASMPVLAALFLLLRTSTAGAFPFQKISPKTVP
tara:strand:- start:100 stop:384 length:285 start_codon:yes stop_codon:yes gene_type:complete